MTAVFGTDDQALLNHYLNFGMAEGRLPAADAQPGEMVDGMQTFPLKNSFTESPSPFVSDLRTE